MITFKTMTGSIYEVRPENKLIRRASGEPNVTVRATSEWRPYSELVLKLHYPAIIVWTDETPPLPNTPEECIVCPMTQTSMVTEIVDG